MRAAMALLPAYGLSAMVAGRIAAPPPDALLVSAVEEEEAGLLRGGYATKPTGEEEADDNGGIILGPAAGDDWTTTTMTMTMPLPGLSIRPGGDGGSGGGNDEDDDGGPQSPRRRRERQRRRRRGRAQRGRRRRRNNLRRRRRRTLRNVFDKVEASASATAAATREGGGGDESSAPPRAPPHASRIDHAESPRYDFSSYSSYAGSGPAAAASAAAAAAASVRGTEAESASSTAAAASAAATAARGGGGNGGDVDVAARAQKSRDPPPWASAAAANPPPWSAAVSRAAGNDADNNDDGNSSDVQKKRKKKKCKTKSCCLSLPDASSKKSCCNSLRAGYKWRDRSGTCRKVACPTKACCSLRNRQAKRNNREFRMDKCCDGLDGWEWRIGGGGGSRGRCVASSALATTSSTTAPAGLSGGTVSKPDLQIPNPGGGSKPCESDGDCGEGGKCALSQYEPNTPMVCCPLGRSIQVRPFLARDCITYTIADRDGNTDTATLCFDVMGNEVDPLAEYCAGTIFEGRDCGNNEQCAGSGVCVGGGRVGTCTAGPVGAGGACDEDMDCDGTTACALGEYSPGAKKVCCSGGGRAVDLPKAGTVPNEAEAEEETDRYCSSLPPLAQCHSSSMCPTVDERTGRHAACGREAYVPGSRRVCCPSEEAVRVFLPGSDFESDDYCTGMVGGKACGRDEMCVSGRCLAGVCA